MELLAVVLSGVKNVMDFDMTLYGFTFSYWDILLWSIIAGVVFYVIVRYFDG